MKKISAQHAEQFEFLSALALTVLLALMHLMLLMNRGPLWRDEISSLSLASAPSLQRFWAGLGLDPLPALFPLVLRYWKAIVGDSDFRLRILGCLIGLGCLGAFWLNARLTGRKTPILSLLLLGFCPTLIIWGDSLRGYGIGVFWIVISFALFWRQIERPSGRIFAATSAAAIFSVHSVYSNALIIFSCGIAAAIVAARRRQWRRVGLSLGAGAVAALTLLPYATLFQTTASWAGLAQIDFSLMNSFRVLCSALYVSGNNLLWEWRILVVAAIGAACIFQRRKIFDRMEPARRDASLYALISAVVGFVGTMAFFRAVGWGTNVWYYLPMLAVVAVAIDLIFDFGTLVRLAPVARVVVVIIGLAFSLPFSIHAIDVRASNIDVVAQVVSEKAAPDDLVVVWPSADGITFGRYLHRPLNWVTVPIAPHLPAEPGDDVLGPFLHPDCVQPILERVRATLHEHHRVWIASTWPLALPDGPVPPVLPLSKSNPRKLGYFLRGWGYLLVDQLHQHAARAQRVDLNEEQPVSIYEQSTLWIFSGWKEADASAPSADDHSLTAR